MSATSFPAGVPSADGSVSASPGVVGAPHTAAAAAEASPHVRHHHQKHLTSRAQLVSSGVTLSLDERYAEAAAVFRGLADRLDPGDTEAVEFLDGPAATFLAEAGTTASKSQRRKSGTKGILVVTRKDALELHRDARFKAARAALQQQERKENSNGGDDVRGGGSPPRSGESPMSVGRLSSNSRTGGGGGATRSSGRFRRTSDLRQHPAEEEHGDMMVDPAELESIVERENQAWLDLADAWPPASSSSSPPVVVIRGDPVPRLQAAQTALTWWQRSRAKLAIACRAKANALPVDSTEARELYVRSLSFDASSDTNASAWNNLAASLGHGDGDYVRIGDGSYTRIECFLTALENPDLQARAAVWANAIKCFGDDERNVPRYGHVSRSELAVLLVVADGSRHQKTTKTKHHQAGQGSAAAATAPAGSMGAGGGPIFSDPVDVALIKHAAAASPSSSSNGKGKGGFFSSVFGRKTEKKG